MGAHRPRGERLPTGRRRRLAPARGRHPDHRGQPAQAREAAPHQCEHEQPPVHRRRRPRSRASPARPVARFGRGLRAPRLAGGPGPLDLGQRRTRPRRPQRADPLRRAPHQRGAGHHAAVHRAPRPSPRLPGRRLLARRAATAIPTPRAASSCHRLPGRRPRPSPAGISPHPSRPSTPAGRRPSPPSSGTSAASTTPGRP